MRRIRDFSGYEGILPYASETFGVYQPLLGWRSGRMKQRWKRGYHNDLKRAASSLLERFEGQVDVGFESDADEPIVRALELGSLRASDVRGSGSVLVQELARELPPLESYDESLWTTLLSKGHLKTVLTKQVVPAVMASRGTGTAANWNADAADLKVRLQRESAMAGLLTQLRATKAHDMLKEIFYKEDTRAAELQRLMQYRDPLDYLDPFRDLDRASLSPIGVIHLFRQYFFELDSFLGAPVNHVWLSPGSTVELMEVTTRRKLVERSTEMFMETIVRTEKVTVDEEEISDAVKQENRSDTRFGMNATVNQSWISGDVTATSSLNVDSTQSIARESTHRRMRQQTEKLSTEIRKNFKSTFRTVTESTDVSSKRHVLANTTDDLINYELRRKMRQVGVQVQDIGTYLCWQAYVDHPGRQLGVARLVHLAQGPDVGSAPPPEAVPMPALSITQHTIDIPFVPQTEDTEPSEDMDEAYRDGVEVNTDPLEGTRERIQWKFDGLSAMCGQPGYEFQSIDVDKGGNDVTLEFVNVTETTPGSIQFGVQLRHVNFRNQSPMRITAKVTWQPTASVRAAVEQKNLERVEEYTEATKREFQGAFVSAARERIMLESKITARPFEDLREEERIVVYRALIQDLLTRGIPIPDDRTRHVVSELLNTIFDVDKMLYFVAPEWWRPRLHRYSQRLGGLRGDNSGQPRIGRNPATGEAIEIPGRGRPNETIAEIDTADWGGGSDPRRDNYFITEDSDPAKLGSSLGWLLQLDGDNLRNAFLNAPWVKAVIPVRPGKERAAMNWLQRLHIEGTEGLEDEYVASPEELSEIRHAGARVTVGDAIHHMCDVVAEKHAASTRVGRHPTSEIDDSDRVSASPIDRVYEHGFYALQGGFRASPSEEFEVFDQWVEVLPTDQIVPVPVSYDPRTGRQL